MIKSISEKIEEGLQKFYTAFKSQRILTTSEEVMANTNPDNLASAVVVGELYNNLGGNIITYENGKYYIQAGADAASKKPLGSGSYKIVLGLQWNTQLKIGGKDYTHVTSSCNLNITIIDGAVTDRTVTNAQLKTTSSFTSPGDGYVLSAGTSGISITSVSITEL